MLANVSDSDARWTVFPSLLTALKVNSDSFVDDKLGRLLWTFFKTEFRHSPGHWSERIVFVNESNYANKQHIEKFKKWLLESVESFERVE